MKNATRRRFDSSSRLAIEDYWAALGAAGAVRKSSRGLTRRGHCPAHEDSHPSCDITQTVGGATLFHCWAGCSQREIIEALIMRGLWKSQSERPSIIASVFRWEDHVSPRPPQIPDCCLATAVCKHWRAFDAEYLIVNLHKNLRNAADELKAKLLRAGQPTTQMALREGIEFAIQFGAIVPMGTARAVLPRLIDVVLEGI
jgi:hypothetical protein